jgi:hypothetical protein
LGFGLGAGYYDPWYYDYPYYPSYSYAAPPPDAYDQAAGTPPATACGSWTWDTGRSQYFWTPCS